MTNTELQANFMAIAAETNSFTEYENLKEFKAEYKHSDFYKKTKMPIKKAYSLFLQGCVKNTAITVYNLVDTKYLGQKLTEVINNVDPQALDDKLQAILEQFNLKDLSTEKGELNDLINKMKTSI